MSSTAKTPILGLNQWEASDAPQRVDFNADNLRIDTAMGDSRLRMDGIAADLEEVNHDLYRLYLQQYYEYKDVPHRATLFFDAFRDVTMMDAASNVYLDQVNYCLCGWDKRFYGQGMLYYYDTCQLGLSDAGRDVGMAQSYPSAGPIRLHKLSVPYRPSYITGSSHSVNLSLYAANAQGLPQTLRQVLTTVTQGVTGGGENKTVDYSPASPLLIGDTHFAFAVENSTLSGTQYLRFGVNTQQGLQGPVFSQKYGASWAQQAVVYDFRMIMSVTAAQISNPPKWVTREVTLSRPCSTVTVFITQDAASVARNTVKVALYNAGETAVYMNMARDSSKDIPLSGGKTETCYTYTQPMQKTRARLTLQLDGTNPNDRIYEYGCVLSD